MFWFLSGSRYGRRREDPTQPLTLALTLTPNRNQNGPKLPINAAAPRLHRPRKILNCGRRFRSADRATQFSSQKHLKIPFPRSLNLLVRSALGMSLRRQTRSSQRGLGAWALRKVQRTRRLSSRCQTTTTAVGLGFCSNLSPQK